MLGANELPLRQGFGLRSKRLYGALAPPARRPVMEAYHHLTAEMNSAYGNSPPPQAAPN